MHTQPPIDGQITAQVQSSAQSPVSTSSHADAHVDAGNGASSQAVPAPTLRSTPRLQEASWYSRLSAVAVMLGLVGLLLTARILQPSSSGYGTHQQLGLPPCTTIAMWGVRCPACGMTTAWSYAMRGQWSAAWQANAGGLVMVLIALATIPTFCYYVAQGRWSRHGWLSFSLALSLSAALLAALAQWLVRIVQGS